MERWTRTCTTTGRDAAGSPLPSTPRCGGLWHLSVASGLPLPVRVVELVTVHVALGVPLSFAWRRSRNLAGPALAHPVNDAVRNAAMLGLKILAPDVARWVGNAW